MEIKLGLVGLRPKPFTHIFTIQLAIYDQIRRFEISTADPDSDLEPMLEFFARVENGAFEYSNCIS